MIVFHPHLPTFIEGVRPVPTQEFATLEALLESLTREWGPRSFSHWARSDTRIMAVLDEGTTWWVMGRTDADLSSLPKWAPVYLGFLNGVPTRLPDGDVKTKCFGEITLQNGSIVKAATYDEWVRAGRPEHPITDTSMDKSGLKHGPLTADMVPLLTAGSSVLRVRSYGDQMRLATFVRASPANPELHDNPVVVVDEEGQTAPNCWGIHRFTYIGERGPDGWITAPESGWTENPVPGVLVEVRYDDASDDAVEPSETAPWRSTLPRIIAFRPVEARSHSPAIGEQAAVPDGWRTKGPRGGWLTMWGDLKPLNWSQAEPIYLRPAPPAFACLPDREEVDMGGGDVIALVDPSRWDHPTAPQLAYANGWNDALSAPPSAAGVDWTDIEDALSDAIQDSIDMDWNSRDGAKAVVRWLKARPSLCDTAPQPVKMLVDQDWLNRRMEQDDPDLDCEATAPQPQADMAVAIKALEEVLVASRITRARAAAAEALRKLEKADV